MYNDVMNSMDGARTLGDHITRLQNIVDLSPVDPQLEAFLKSAITQLTQDQLKAAKLRQASQRVPLNPSADRKYQQLYSYCQQHAPAAIPQWQVAAQNAGWTPPKVS